MNPGSAKDMSVTNNADQSSTLNRGFDFTRNSLSNSSTLPPIDAQPGDKVAPGKVVNEKGEVEKTATREGIEAAANLGSLFVGGGSGGAAKTAAEQGVKETAKQTATAAAKESVNEGAKAAVKGANAGNRSVFNKASASNPFIDNFKNKGMQKVGAAIDTVAGKAADTLEEVPGVKEAAEDNKEGFKAVNQTFDAVGSATQGDFKGAKDKLKDAKKNAKTFGKKKMFKSLKFKIIIACLPFFFIIIICMCAILPFTGGYKKLSDFGYDDSSLSGSGGYGGGGVTTITYLSENQLDESQKAVLSSVENYESLSSTRKKFVLAAVVSVGKDYLPDGLPTGNTTDENSWGGGLDSNGWIEWQIWNVTGKDYGPIFSSTLKAGDTVFVEIPGDELMPGDYGVDGEDIAVYLGNNQWVHKDWVSSYVVGPSEYYTSFYRYREIDNPIAALTGPPKTGKTADMFPGGQLPGSADEMKPFLVTVEVPMTKRDGTKFVSKLTLHKDVAKQIQQVFQEAQDGGFKIYDAYCYSWRNIANSSSRSQHSYGLACDINYRENYCYYVDESKPGGVGEICYEGWWKPGEDEFSAGQDSAVVQAFYRIGWGWGGDWHSKKDYMHFSYNGG